MLPISHTNPHLRVGKDNNYYDVTLICKYRYLSELLPQFTFNVIITKLLNNWQHEERAKTATIHLTHTILG